MKLEAPTFHSVLTRSFTMLSNEFSNSLHSFFKLYFTGTYNILLWPRDIVCGPTGGNFVTGTGWSTSPYMHLNPTIKNAQKDSDNDDCSVLLWLPTIYTAY